MLHEQRTGAAQRYADDGSATQGTMPSVRLFVIQKINQAKSIFFLPSL